MRVSTRRPCPHQRRASPVRRAWLPRRPDLVARSGDRRYLAPHERRVRLALRPTPASPHTRMWISRFSTHTRILIERASRPWAPFRPVSRRAAYWPHEASFPPGGAPGHDMTTWAVSAVSWLPVYDSLSAFLGPLSHRPPSDIFAWRPVSVCTTRTPQRLRAWSYDRHRR